jgi:hypothetical protein
MICDARKTVEGDCCILRHVASLGRGRATPKRSAESRSKIGLNHGLQLIKTRNTACDDPAQQYALRGNTA